jgi:UDP-glucuronate 4-epimerase
VANSDHSFDFEVFNLAECFCVTLQELAGHLVRVSGRKVKLHKMPTQPGDVEITYANISKARELLGYRPSTSLTEGLTKFIQWYERRNTNSSQP